MTTEWVQKRTIGENLNDVRKNTEEDQWRESE